jgi:porin
MLTLLPSAAGAEESATLTSDWGGARSDLTGAGVDLTGGYISEIATNPQGGTSQQVAYVDQWSIGATLDLQKLLKWPDSKFQITITNRNGNDLNNRANLGTLQAVQDLYGGGQTWRLTDFWFDQVFSGSRLDWKIGRLTVGEDFADFTCNFQNLTFCGSSPGNIGANYWYNSPVSQWATRLKFAISPQLDVQIGVYQVNPTYNNPVWAQANGLFPNFPGGTTGVLIPVALDWKPAPWGKTGSYKVGVWYNTSDADDVYLNTNEQPLVIAGGSPLRRHSSSGGYFNLEQPLSANANQVGAKVFINGLISDDETSPLVDRQFAVGIEYKGLIDLRPQDYTGIALGTNRVNSRVAEGEILLNEAKGGDMVVQGSEYVTEAFYSWWIVKYLNLRPSVQYVVQPGGTSRNSNILVIGLRTAAVF